MATLTLNPPLAFYGRYASRCALRALDAALACNGANCERFVDIRGFKTLFPLLGSPPPTQPAFAKGRGEKEQAQRAHDEHVAGMVLTLFHQLADERRLKELLRLAVKDLTHTTDDRLGKVDMVLKDMKNAPPVLREDARVLAKDIWKFHTDGRSRRESRMELQLAARRTFNLTAYSSA